MDIRVGFGFDIHQLQDGEDLILGGINIPHSKGTLGHSDADVLLHEITDAILGAANMRDIGYHFPDTDPRYKGADSKILLRDAWTLVKNRDYTFGNVDCTICIEKPKISPHIDAMRAQIASILECDEDILKMNF